MIISGNMQRLCYGGWILAALVLIAINGFGFLSIEGQTLEGYSPLIKSLQQKLARLENTLSIHRAIDIGKKEFQHLFAAYDHAKLSTIEDNKITDGGDNSSAINNEPVLPSLNGIIQVMDSSGSTYYTALIEGKTYRKKDRIMNFVITEISSHGVILSRSNKRWFIQCPTIYYSIDRGE